MHRWSTENSGGSETTRYDVTAVDAGHHTCVSKPPTVNPNVNWTLGECDVSMQLHQLQQCISLIMGETVNGVGGAVSIWKISPPSQFCCEPKISF